jgi:hypothetical protein
VKSIVWCALGTQPTVAHGLLIDASGVLYRMLQLVRRARRPGTADWMAVTPVKRDPHGIESSHTST